MALSFITPQAISTSGSNTQDCSTLVMDKVFNIPISLTNQVRVLKFYPISILSKANSAMIEKMARELLFMFRVISTKDNGVTICIRDMEYYTATQVNTKATSDKVKNMG